MRKNNLFHFFSVICLSFFLVFFSNQFIASATKEKLKEFKQEVLLKRNTAKVDFILSHQNYLLKIKHVILNGEPKKVYINGNTVKPFVTKRKKVIETNLFFIPARLTRQGANSIEILFPENYPADLDIVITNYRKQIKNQILVLFYDYPKDSVFGVSFLGSLTILIAILLFLLFMVYCLRIFLNLGIDTLSLYQACSLLPILIFLSVLRLWSELDKSYRIVMTAGYFWMLCFFIFFISMTSIFIIKIMQGYGRRVYSFVIPGSSFIIKIMQGHGSRVYSFVIPELNKVFFRLVQWVKSISFSDKCLSLCIILLILSALFSVLLLHPVNEQCANAAYLFLGAGILIKSWNCFFYKNHKK